MLDELISAFYLSKVDEAYIWSMKDSWELRFVIKLPQRVEGYNYIFLKPLLTLKNAEILRRQAFCMIPRMIPTE